MSIQDLRDQRVACECGHKLFIIVPNHDLTNICCFICGTVYGTVV